MYAYICAPAAPTGVKTQRSSKLTFHCSTRDGKKTPPVGGTTAKGKGSSFVTPGALQQG